MSWYYSKNGTQLGPVAEGELSAKVDGLVAQGDIPGAQAAAKSAKMWTNISVISWVAVVILVILAGVISEA